MAREEKRIFRAERLTWEELKQRHKYRAIYIETAENVWVEIQL